MSIFLFINDPATTEIYTLSLHDALPISRVEDLRVRDQLGGLARRGGRADDRPVSRHPDELGVLRVAVVDEDGRPGHLRSMSSAEKSSSRRSSPRYRYHSKVCASPAASV